MIRFKRLKALDTFAYRSLDFTFDDGIHSVVGVNGASKTSIFLTLIQGLFNKNPKGMKIAEVSNSITNEPYEIEIWFDKDGVEYWIKNSKKTGKLEITEAGRPIGLQRIPDCLKQIEDILGCNYDMFVDLVYQSPKSSINLLETNSDGERKKFINRILRLDELDWYLEKMKAREKELVGKNGRLPALQKQVETYENSLTDLQTELAEIDTVRPEEELRICWGAFDELKERRAELNREVQECTTLLKSAEDNAASIRALRIAENTLQNSKLPATPVKELEERSKITEAEWLKVRGELATAKSLLLRYTNASRSLSRIKELQEELAGFISPEHPHVFVAEQLGKLTALQVKTEALRASKLVEVNSLTTAAKAGNCPTCGHGVATGIFDEKLAQLNASLSADDSLLAKCAESLKKYLVMQTVWMRLADLKQELERLQGNPDTQIDGEKARHDVDYLTEALETLHQQHKDLEEEVGLYRKYWAAESDVNRLKALAGPETDTAEVRQRLEGLLATRTSLEVSITSTEVQIKEIDKQLTSLKDHNALARARKELNRQIEESNRNIRLQLDASRKELVEAESTLERVRNWLGILGSKGYRVHKIKRFLKNLNTTMSKYSGMICNGRIKCRFFIDEAGEIQFEIKDAFKTISYAGWSEGQKARVNLACLFAVLEILEGMGTVSFNILCLDDMLGTIDEDGKQGLFNVLAYLKNNNRSVYTVSQFTLALALKYDTVITAQMHEDGTTSITQ